MRFRLGVSDPSGAAARAGTSASEPRVARMDSGFRNVGECLARLATRASDDEVPTRAAAPEGSETPKRKRKIGFV